MTWLTVLKIVNRFWQNTYNTHDAYAYYVRRRITLLSFRDTSLPSRQSAYINKARRRPYSGELIVIIRRHAIRFRDNQNIFASLSNRTYASMEMQASTVALFVSVDSRRYRIKMGADHRLKRK